MKENIVQNYGILKEKELLEKLSREISRDFFLSEKLAKKLIYKTHLSLDDLKGEIYLEQKENGLEQKNEKLNDEKLNKLLSVLDGVRKIIEQASKDEIEELKNILESTSNSDLFNDSETIKKLFSNKVIDRAKNPRNIPDQIMGVTLGITSSVIMITESLYDLGRGIITSVPDLIFILKGKGEIESFKKM